MNNLCLCPVMQDLGLGKSRRQGQSMLKIEPDDCLQDLWLERTGRLVLRSTEKAPSSKKATLLGVLASQPTTAGGQYSWWISPRSPLLSINGVRPMPLAALRGGDLIAHGDGRWMVTSEWVPTPRPAPDSVAKRQCPVCGAELELAPVIQCPCGRYYHLENPDDPQNSELLNCYLSAPCGLCGREPSLEPTLVPELHETLLDQEVLW